MVATVRIAAAPIDPSYSSRRDGQGESGSPRRRSKTPCGRSVDFAVAERLQFARLFSACCSVARSLASRSLSARCGVALFLCTTWRREVSAPRGIVRFLRHTWRRAVPLHDVKSAVPQQNVSSSGPSVRRDVAQSLCTTWHCAVSLYLVASRGSSARLSVVRSCCTT